MSYVPLFDVAALEKSRPKTTGVSYVYSPELELAVNVALAARRPLLLSGLPGTGKSTLAEDIAWKLDRRFYTQTITSRTTADDLQWTYDAVRKLSMAAGGAGKLDDKDFTRPGALWRAFSPDSAAKLDEREAEDGRRDAVVLLDEIDKAEPDVPNDLLVVLDRREFAVRETGQHVKMDDRDVLIVITTNNERDLPPAFVRRCITFDIRFPDDKKDLARLFHEIARRHFKEATDRLIDKAFDLYDALRTSATAANVRQPSTAEFLDALRALERVKLAEPDADAQWERIATAAMWKHTKPPQLPARG